MSAGPTPVSPTPQPPLPNLPCPNCGKNLLVEGFYNSCTETTRVHEDNRTYIVRDRLYMDHDEETLDTIDHECDLEASSHRLLLKRPQSQALPSTISKRR